MTESLNTDTGKRRDSRVIIPSWSITVVYMAFIFFLSSRPSPEALPEFTFADKFYHVIEYGILGILLFRAFMVSLPGKGYRYILFMSSVIGLLYGVSDEFHQYFVPERFSTVSDVIADGVGGFLGAYIYMKVRCKDKNV